MLLEFKDIYKNYDKKEVLKGISFQVQSGRPLAFLGRNGAGKTTTIRILMDVITKNSGEITLDGKRFRAGDYKIGYLPEERGMYQKIKILEQLIYFGELKGYDPHAAKKSARNLLEKVGLSEYENKKLEVLSKGNQQKVQLAQTLIGDPEIIIMDEPFSGLDPINSNLLMELILENSGKDKLMLFSSHQMGYVDEICSDLAILSDGKVVVNENIETLKREMARNKVFIVPKDGSLEQFSNALKDKGYESIVQEDKVVVDLSNSDQVEFLKMATNMGIIIESYGLLKPTLSDIFVEYAR